MEIQKTWELIVATSLHGLNRQFNKCIICNSILAVEVDLYKENERTNDNDITYFCNRKGVAEWDKGKLRSWEVGRDAR